MIKKIYISKDRDNRHQSKINISERPLEKVITGKSIDGGNEIMYELTNYSIEDIFSEFVQRGCQKQIIITDEEDVAIIRHIKKSD